MKKEGKEEGKEGGKNRREGGREMLWTNCDIRGDIQLLNLSFVFYTTDIISLKGLCHPFKYFFSPHLRIHLLI